jgi:hypothetical protein
MRLWHRKCNEEVKFLLKASCIYKYARFWTQNVQIVWILRHG